MTESAAKGDRVQRPHDWDTCVAVAYLRLLGATQKQAAEGAGCGVRSIQDWETCSWWADAKQEADDRWLHNVTAKARKVLLEELDLGHAFKVVERRVDSLAPPKVRQELTGKDGGPIEIDADETRRKFISRISELAGRVGTGDVGPNGNGGPQ